MTEGMSIISIRRFSSIIHVIIYLVCQSARSQLPRLLSHVRTALSTTTITIIYWKQTCTLCAKCQVPSMLAYNYRDCDHTYCTYMHRLIKCWVAFVSFFCSNNLTVWKGVSGRWLGVLGVRGSGWKGSGVRGGKWG